MASQCVYTRPLNPGDQFEQVGPKETPCDHFGKVGQGVTLVTVGLEAILGDRFGQLGPEATHGDQYGQVGLEVTPGVQLGQDGLGEPGNLGRLAQKRPLVTYLDRMFQE